MKSQDLVSMHELIMVMSVGKWVCYEMLNNYDLSGGCIFIFIYIYVHS